ncbi:serine hydrolase [Mesorhizobium sp. WSM4887]|uniref:serine hydrolase n=1 Tax=Mesorhizobium sp. WSM4887 TaxID=3038543 RepID=UPI002416838C|nr:serine hydrolase [Mesorhizobium sp. WSM4887]MDG4890558.1 serine hydrolase [Mesorhizobium sp. WSM4887]
MTSITRRSALAGAFASLPIVRIQAATRPGKPDVVAATKAVEALEARNGGRLGVMVLDIGTNAAIEYRADELFPMTSTFKFLAAAGVLKAVDDGKAKLDDRIVYGHRRNPLAARGRTHSRSRLLHRIHRAAGVARGSPRRYGPHHRRDVRGIARPGRRRGLKGSCRRFGEYTNPLSAGIAESAA